MPLSCPPLSNTLPYPYSYPNFTPTITPNHLPNTLPPTLSLRLPPTPNPSPTIPLLLPLHITSYPTHNLLPYPTLLIPILYPYSRLVHSADEYNLHGAKRLFIPNVLESVDVYNVWQKYWGSVKTKLKINVISESINDASVVVLIVGVVFLCCLLLYVFI